MFGPEFIGRVEAIVDRMPRLDPRFFVGADCPTFAESYSEVTADCSGEPPAIEHLRGGRRRHLLLLRHHRLPQGHPARPPQHHVGRRGGAEPSRPGPRRQLPLHRPALPHRRQDALVRQPAVGQQGRAAARHQAGVDPPDHLRREGHHRLAAGPLGAGHPAGHRPGRRQARRLRAGPVAAHAHRRPAGAAQPGPPLAGALPRPPVRHRLRPHRVGGPGLRAPGRRERPQGGRHRHGRATSGRPRSSTNPGRRSRRAPSASWRSRARAS